MTTDNNNMMVPTLRFKEFDGEWEKKKLGEIARITTGNTPSTSVPEFYNGSNLFVSPADLNDGRYVHKTKTTLTELGFNEGRKISKGSVLFVCIGSTIGKVGQTTEECLTNQQINSLEALKDFDNNFIYGLLEKNGKKIKLLAGVQAVPQINKTDFSNFKYLFPTLPEQQKIASFLSAVDEKIQQLSRKKELLEQYKKGVMQQLFSGTLRFKDEKGKAFPKWEEKRLGDVCERIGDGIHSTPSYDESGNYYFVNGNNLSNGKIVINETTKKVTESEYLKHNRELSSRSILISINGTIGNIAVYDNEKIVLGKSACYININASVDLKYIYLIIQSSSIINYFYSELTGSTIKNLSLKTIRETPINLPCLEEQQKIATYLSNIDIKIESVKKQIAQSQSFKKGLLQGMFV